MTKKFKIYLAIFLMLFSFNAKAVWPLFVMTGLVDAGGVVSASGIGAAITGLGIGGLIGQRMGMINLSKDDNSESIRIPLTNLPRDRPTVDLPPDTPTTYIPSSLGCPASYSEQAACASFGACYYTRTYTFALSGNQCVASVTSSGVPTDGSNTYGVVEGTLTGQPFPASQVPPEQRTCDNGYTSSNGNCVLTEPEKIPDKHCDLQVSANSSGGKLIKSNIDPDCASSPVNVSPDGVAHIPVSLANPTTGLPEERHVIVVPDGGSGSNCYYQVCIPVQGLPGHYQIGLTSTGTSPNTTNYQVISVGSDGVVDGIRSGTITGTITTSGTYVDANGVTQTIANGQAVLTNVNAAGQAVQATSAAQTQVINMPSDYARTGEASTAADKIVNKLNESQNAEDLAAPDLDNPLVSYFNPLRSWTVPSQAGQCPSGSFSWNNNTYSFNVMCQLFSENLTLIQAVMNVFYVILALFIVLGA